MLFTIGSDVEFGVLKNGKPVSAEGLIAGTKWKPLRFRNGWMVSHDNVLAEVATPICREEAEFVDKVLQCRDILNEYLAGYALSPDPCLEFEASELQTPTAMEFGCDPDFNVWTMMENVPPLAIGNRMRSCGGHVHIGAPEFTNDDGKVRLGRWMDAILGSATTTVYNSQLEAARRVLYGRSGCVRPKDYGIEYRVLSNGWTGAEDSIKMVYRLSEDACYAASSDLLPEWFVDKETLAHAINKADRDAASLLLNILTSAGIVTYDTREAIEACM